MDKPTLRGRSLKSLFPKELHALELQYDTPHALIAHDALDFLLKRCNRGVRGAVLRKHAEYVEKSRTIQRNIVKPEARGEGYRQDYIEGLVESLQEHKIFNAYFYGLKCLQRNQFEGLRKAFLEIASHEVDRLGHVFIYTESCLRLMAATSDSTRKELLLDLVEYTSRKAQIEVGEIYHTDETMESLLRDSLEKIGLLGHNTILARSLHLRRNDLEKTKLEHGFAQLRRNIDASDPGMSASDVHDIKPLQLSGNPLEILPKRIWSGDFESVAQAIRGFLIDDRNVDRIWLAIALAFSKIKATQPHYFILTESAWYISGLLGNRLMELAMLQTAKMATEAAADRGVEAE